MFQLENQDFIIFGISKEGPKKAQKRAKMGIYTTNAICDPISNETMLERGWNGTEYIQANQFG